MVASRTDRGVHALGNAIALESPLRGPVLLRALGSVAPDLFFTHAREVDEAFIPRRALRRTYRYFEPLAGRSPERWRSAGELLVGPMDVRSFGRGLPGDRPTIRTVEKVGIAETGELLRVEVVAPSFVWGMVRKIVSALRQYDAGTLSGASLRAAVEGRRRLALPLAEPERLVLWDVQFEGAWEFERPTARRRAAPWGLAAAEAALVRRAVVEALRTGGEPGTGGDAAARVL
jgi:tRNA pseudouridine(38-40) synthase